MGARDALPDISPFHEIEVWCSFTRRWVPGFWLDGLEPDGSIRLRRGIDQAPLSGSVPANSVRTRQVDPGRVIDLRARPEPARPQTTLPQPSLPEPSAPEPSAPEPSAPEVSALLSPDPGA